MHRHNVVAAALSGDGARLATGSVGGEVLVWSTRPLVPIRDLPPRTPRGKISALALSPDGSEALVAPDWKPAVERWDLTAGVQRGELAAHTGRTTAIAYDPAGGLIATGGADRAAVAGAAASTDDDTPPSLVAPTVRLWRSGARVRELSGLAQRIGAIAFSRDGALVAAGGENAVKVWRTTDGAEVAAYELRGEAAAVAFRGDQLCAASSETAACFAGPGDRGARRGRRRADRDQDPGALRLMITAVP
jgi:WD40 repeat protein